MKEIKKAVLHGLKKGLTPSDKLEQLVVDFAIRKTAGSREDLDGVFYSKNGKHVIMAAKSMSGSYTVCEGVREIDADAFWGCAFLESITLPEGLESIGHEAFGRCISLRSLTIPESVVKLGTNPFIGTRDLNIVSKSPQIKFDGKAVYSDGGKTLVAYIADDKEYSVANGVTTIGEKAFYGKKNLQRITLPESLKVIDDEAFFDCDKLLGITIGKNVDKIGECAFGDNINLRTIEFCGVPSKMKRTMLAGCDELRSMVIPYGTMQKFRKIARDFEDRVVEKGKRKSPIYK